MTKKELSRKQEKQLAKRLGSAYVLEESAGGRVFVRKYEQRRMNLAEVMLLETRYLGLRSAACGAALFMMLFFIVRTESYHAMWTLSSILPLCMLACITAIGKSERYGMSEFEATSRFSLKMVRGARMMVLGIISFVIIGVGTAVVENVLEVGLLKVLGCLCLPYLLNILGCLIVIRRWHAAENIYGCCGVTFATCLIPYLVENADLMSAVSGLGLMGIIGLVFIVTIVECILYFRESESLSWNLY